MFKNLIPDLQFVPEPGEQLISQYRTHQVVDRYHPGGDAGTLVITSQRIVFFKRESVLKKVVGKIIGKPDAPSYTQVFSIPIPQIYKVTSKGGSRRCVIINGTWFFLENADPRPIVKVLKTMMKSVKKGTFVAAPVQAPAVTRTVINPQVPQVTMAPQKNFFCKLCGAENKPDAIFCCGCGVKIDK